MQVSHTTDFLSLRVETMLNSVSASDLTDCQALESFRTRYLPKCDKFPLLWLVPPTLTIARASLCPKRYVRKYLSYPVRCSKPRDRTLTLIYLVSKKGAEWSKLWRLLPTFLYPAYSIRKEANKNMVLIGPSFFDMWFGIDNAFCNSIALRSIVQTCLWILTISKSNYVSPLHNETLWTRKVLSGLHKAYTWPLRSHLTVLRLSPFHVSLSAIPKCQYCTAPLREAR